jgi:FKBP-type peptidyl-prolyl cis-trans isomerase 2
MAEVSKGDIIYMDYVGYISESNEVFDTTIEEVAKESGIYNANARYQPIVVAVGAKWVIEGVDESLIGKKEGEEYEVDVPPEKGYGNRDPNKIKIMTEKRLRDAGVKGDITPGAIIEVNGAPAVVRVVSGGRVLVDFNPPLAGKHLKYKIIIKKICKTVKEKIEAIITRHNGELLKNVRIKISEKTGVVEIKLDGYSIENPSIHFIKKEIADDILLLINKIKTVRYVEQISREEEEQETQKAESEADTG